MLLTDGECICVTPPGDGVPGVGAKAGAPVAGALGAGAGAAGAAAGGALVVWAAAEFAAINVAATVMAKDRTHVTPLCELEGQRDVGVCVPAIGDRRRATLLSIPVLGDGYDRTNAFPRSSAYHAAPASSIPAVRAAHRLRDREACFRRRFLGT